MIQNEIKLRKILPKHTETSTRDLRQISSNKFKTTNSLDPCGVLCFIFLILWFSSLITFEKSWGNVFTKETRKAYTNWLGLGGAGMSWPHTAWEECVMVDDGGSIMFWNVSHALQPIQIIPNCCKPKLICIQLLIRSTGYFFRHGNWDILRWTMFRAYGCIGKMCYHNYAFNTFQRSPAAMRAFNHAWNRHVTKRCG